MDAVSSFFSSFNLMPSWTPYLVGGVLLAVLVLGRLEKLGFHHVTEPIFRQWRHLAETTGKRYAIRTVLVLFAIALVLLAGRAVWTSFEEAELVASAEAVAQEEPQRIEALYVALCEQDVPAFADMEAEVAPEGAADEEDATDSFFSKLAFWRDDDVESEHAPAELEQQATVCVTKQFAPVEHVNDAVATAMVDADEGQPTIRVVVKFPTTDMKFVVRKAPQNNGELLWVAKEDHYVGFGPFYDEPNFNLAMNRAVSELTRQCVQ